jgi:hypothetical protein
MAARDVCAVGREHGDEDDPGSGATGYFVCKPGVQNTASSTPNATPTGTGWVQDLAGGTGFPAGTWSFSVKTQIPSANLVAGTAILAVGIWKGTIKNNGSFMAKQTILAPTDDPAAQNIRCALSRTTPSPSVPAFTLASATGCTSTSGASGRRHQPATASDREVDLSPATVAARSRTRRRTTIARERVQRHQARPAASISRVPAAPRDALYRGAAPALPARSAATDRVGVQQVNYPAVTTAGWTHAADTITASPTYTSSTYSWTAGATTSLERRRSPRRTALREHRLADHDHQRPTARRAECRADVAAGVVHDALGGADADRTDRRRRGIDTSSRVYRDEAPLNAGKFDTLPTPGARPSRTLTRPCRAESAIATGCSSPTGLGTSLRRRPRPVRRRLTPRGRRSRRSLSRARTRARPARLSTTDRA